MKYIALIHDDGNNLPALVAGPFPNEGQAQDACQAWLNDNRDEDYEEYEDDPEVIEWSESGNQFHSYYVHRANGMDLKFYVLPLESAFK